MDSKQLRAKLQPLIEQCKSEGMHIEDVISGATNTSFYVDLCMPYLTKENFNDIHDRAFDILWDTTDEETRGFIFTFCVTNECDGMHRCRSVNADELEMA